MMRCGLNLSSLLVVFSLWISLFLLQFEEEELEEGDEEVSSTTLTQKPHNWLPLLV